jgi:TM2 domain-containing membrane protein YozV
MITALALILATQSQPAEAPAVAAPGAEAPAVEAPVSVEPAGDLAQPAAATTLSFGDHLFRDGDWYRAISEYRRYLFLVKGRSAEAPRVAMAIGEALARGEQWDAAGRQLDGVAQRAATTEMRRDALYAAGRAYLLDGRPELAKPRFRLLVEDQETEQRLKAHATWLLAWGHFDAGELAEARVYFQRMADAKAAFAAEAAGVVGRIDSKDELTLKDPLIAGALSIVPGLGHFYLGQWAVGATSLVWNGLFIFAAVSAFLAGDWGVAAVLTIFELGWYAGGIFGAVAGAYRFNRDAVRNWRDDVLASYGQSRALPEMHEVEAEAPGTLLRFTGRF